MTKGHMETYDKGTYTNGDMNKEFMNKIKESAADKKIGHKDENAYEKCGGKKSFDIPIIVMNVLLVLLLFH